MKPTELKAILKSGVKEFAVSPYPVTDQEDPTLPPGVTAANRAKSIRACPSGLTKATVLKMNAPFEVKFTLGCGDQEYTREKKNGVLIEFPVPEKISVWTTKGVKEVPGVVHYKKRRNCTIVERDGVEYVHMVTYAACVLATWGEYAMIEAEREKESAEHEARYQRISAVAEALGVPKDENGSWYGRTRFDREYVRKQNGDIKRDSHGNPLREYVGRIEMPIEQAEKIAAALAKAGVQL